MKTHHFTITVTAKDWVDPLFIGEVLMDALGEYEGDTDGILSFRIDCDTHTDVKVLEEIT